MRGALFAVLVTAGCNQILGIEDPPPEAEPCAGPCAAPAIADPGFESGDLATTYTSGTGAARSIEDPRARSGVRVLELKLRSCPSSAYAHVRVLAPPPAHDAGPALAFWFRMTAGAHAALRVHTHGGSADDLELPRDLQWRRGVMCLDPKLAGRAQELVFSWSATSPCAGDIPAERALLDDLEVTVDPSCPAS